MKTDKEKLAIAVKVLGRIEALCGDRCGVMAKEALKCIKDDKPDTPDAVDWEGMDDWEQHPWDIVRSYILALKGNVDADEGNIADAHEKIADLFALVGEITDNVVWRNEKPGDLDKCICTRHKGNIVYRRHPDCPVCNKPKPDTPDAVDWDAIFPSVDAQGTQDYGRQGAVAKVLVALKGKVDANWTHHDETITLIMEAAEKMSDDIAKLSKRVDDHIDWHMDQPIDAPPESECTFTVAWVPVKCRCKIMKTPAKDDPDYHLSRNDNCPVHGKKEPECRGCHGSVPPGRHLCDACIKEAVRTTSRVIPDEPREGDLVRCWIEGDPDYPSLSIFDHFDEGGRVCTRSRKNKGCWSDYEFVKPTEIDVVRMLKQRLINIRDYCAALTADEALIMVANWASRALATIPDRVRITRETG